MYRMEWLSSTLGSLFGSSSATSAPLANNQRRNENSAVASNAPIMPISANGSITSPIAGGRRKRTQRRHRARRNRSRTARRSQRK